ncbi:hypothetical protein VNO77_24486 [Canavalia gladiata]|uniref:Uncharacterized protein n=1 Tax=Canavalia gladiata TaxID=3824 RepID=A0AAN9L7Q2_CANGL
MSTPLPQRDNLKNPLESGWKEKKWREIDGKKVYSGKNRVSNLKHLFYFPLPFEFDEWEGNFASRDIETQK